MPSVKGKAMVRTAERFLSTWPGFGLYLTASFGGCRELLTPSRYGFGFNAERLSSSFEP